MVVYGGDTYICILKKPDRVKELPLDELVMWDSFSYNVSVTTFYEIAGCTMQYTSRRKVKRKVNIYLLLIGVLVILMS